MIKQEKHSLTNRSRQIETPRPIGWLYKTNGQPLRLTGPLEVLVKFSDTISIPFKAGAEQHLTGENKKFWELLIAKYGDDIRLVPAFSGVSPSAIRSLVKRALKINPNLQDANLLNFYVVAKKNSLEAKKLLLDLEKWPAVDKAFIELPTHLATGCVNASDPRVLCQGYLEPAPKGVDARHAWSQLDICEPNDGPGNGQDFVDIEEDWPISMAGTQLELVDDSTNPCVRPNGGDATHGANVLRIVCGSDTSPGGIGIVPRLQKVKLVSSLCRGGARHAILPAAMALTKRGIMLIEVQIGTPFLPVEANYASFMAIQVCVVAQETICIEPAGNGKLDLDDIIQFGEAIFDRSVRDSGALLVGASRANGNHYQPWPETNKGSIVDSFAWGEKVYAYAADIGGPSSACPNSF